MNKTPLELTKEIQENNRNLLELNGIYHGLLEALMIRDNDSARNEIIKALAYRVSTMAVYASNIYWCANDIERRLTESLESEFVEVEDDLPFVTPGEEEVKA